MLDEEDIKTLINKGINHVSILQYSSLPPNKKKEISFRDPSNFEIVVPMTQIQKSKEKEHWITLDNIAKCLLWIMFIGIALYIYYYYEVETQTKTQRKTNNTETKISPWVVVIVILFIIMLLFTNKEIKKKSSNHQFLL